MICNLFNFLLKRYIVSAVLILCRLKINIRQEFSLCFAVLLKALDKVPDMIILNVR